MEAGSRISTRCLTSLLFSLLFSCVWTIDTKKIDPLLYHEQLLWVSGTGEYMSAYRVPLITYTPKGSLLAFVEARKLSRSDLGTKFIAMRRSTDKGITWSPSTFLIDDDSSPDGLNLGSVVVDEVEGRVILIYSLCFHLYRCPMTSTMMVESIDDGLRWSRPRNLSTQITNFAPGPGFGIQKRFEPHKNRLVVCGHGTLERDGVFCILSDDYGRNWRNGGVLKSIPFQQPKKSLDFNPDECQPVELMDGSIMINIRNQNNYHCRCRMVVYSLDGGETLPIDTLRFDYTLVDPVVAAGALHKDKVIYFTNPSNEQSRVNLTLRWSMNEGQSWEDKTLQIWPGPSGYSSMTTLNSKSPVDQKNIFVIYEKGRRDTTESISFAKIHLYGGSNIWREKGK